MMSKKWLGPVMVWISGVSAAVIILVLVALLISITRGGWDTFGWSFITEAPREGMMKGGVFPAIVGTFLLVMIMSLLSIPVGTLTAVYLTEYARQGSLPSKMVRFAVNSLAGVPAIVFGLFGLGFFVQFVGRGMDKLASGGSALHWGQPNLLWAGLTMGLLTLPVVIVSVEEAIRTVPRELREASLALGATKSQTLWKIVLPNSLPGIMTGGILAISRGAGEVAPLLFTGVAYYLPYLPKSFSDQFMHLGYHLYIMTTQSPDVDATKGIQFATTLVLLLMTFSLNLIAVTIRYQLRKNRRN